MFIFSKIIGYLTQPTVVLLLLTFAGLGVMFWRKRWPRRAGWLQRWAGRGLVLGVAGMVLACFTPLADAVIIPLEERMPRPALSDLPADVVGVITLGGATDTRTTTARRVVLLNEAGERVTETISLAARFPELRVILSGGSAQIFGAEEAEATSMRGLLRDAGVDAERILSEPQSRNTHENAIFTARLIARQRDTKLRTGRWLLLTSAFHMPRAVGCFRQQGVRVIPFPVDYRTSGWSDMFVFPFQPSNALRRLDIATKEWIGLVAYWALGRTSGLFPAPGQDERL
ncbi:MAG: YdcF family protein [Pseudomonadota bacterium]